MKLARFGFLVSSFSALGMAQTMMDNDSVVHLVRAGMNDDVVISIIESQPGSYARNAESLSALRQAGLSERVIAAIMYRGGNQRPGGAKPTAAFAAADPSDSLARAYQASSSVPPLQTEQPLILHDGTPIRLRLNRTLSSEDTQVGQKVDFDVLDDIRAGDQIVIPRGTKAIGAITEAEHKRRMGRGGKLNLVMESITLQDGTKIALRASKATAGGGHAGVMTAGIVATAMLVSLPAAPLFLMIHGKAAIIPEATEITAYTDGDAQVPAFGVRSVSQLR